MSTASAKRGPYDSPAQKRRRQRILSVTQQLLEECGNSGITVKRVAELSGVSLKTIYNIFGGRDDLLIEAASRQLDRMQTSGRIVDEDPGIAQILAFTETTMEQFRRMPDYMRAVISIVIRADTDEKTAQQRVARIQSFTHAALRVAEGRGELRPDTDLMELAQLVSANQWGVALMWERGLLTLEQMVRQANLNQCITLMPFCVGSRRRWLEHRLEALLDGSRDNM